MKTCDVCIIGGGIMGATAAIAIARRGASVVLLDQATLPNPRAASVDHSKVFRFAYPDSLYVRMAVDALGCWRALERETGCQLLLPTGMVALGRHDPGFETQCFAAMREQHIDAAILTAPEAVRRFPQFAAEAFAFAVYDPGGAIARAEDAVRASLDLARRHGVQILERERCTSFVSDGVRTANGTHIACDRVVLAAGPWSAKMLPELAGRLRTTRQEVFYFEPRAPEEFGVGRFPIFIALDSGFYGFPVHHGRAMKIANHHKGPSDDPDRSDDRVYGEADCRAFFRRHLPALADARLVESRVCFYNNTPDDDFILDWHPSHRHVLLATGFSGHGFKFGPLIGRLVAELVTGEPASHPVERFAFGRFAALSAVR